MANDISQASLNLSAEEKRVYGQLFQQADTEGVGVVTGDVAVKFFEKTRLEPPVLGEIWQIGDKENRGFLTPAGFSIVLRLIGHCQNGRTPSAELAMQPGPVPRFDGGAPTIAPAAAPLTQQSSGSAPIRVPPLTPEKVASYSALFEKAGGRNGVLPGDGAKLVFERSQLPNDVLGQIWNLSDKDAKGTLTTTEFIVAMHLMASMRNGSMRAVPQTLPAGLYDAAQRRSPTPSAMGSVARQMTGQGPPRVSSPLSQSFGSPSMSAQTTGNDWLVTPAEKTNYDRAFVSIDTKGAGYITGDQAVPFFSNSGLGEEALATIWDLSDIKSEGQLNRDEFAVAMYLIRQAKGGAPLPSTLPPGLIPPSMRQRAVPPAVSTAPNFENPAPAAPQQKSAADDLFGLDAFSEPAPAPSQTTSNAPKGDPFASDTPASPTSPRAMPPPQPQRAGAGAVTAFGPAFVPSSRFGQDLAAQNTGGSVQSDLSRSRRVEPPASGADDLLGDTDPEVSKKFNSETTELANMSNQIGTLRTQMQEVQGKKSATERDLASSSSQKRDLETRLAQFRTQYEEEVRAVKSLESRLTTSRAETNKLSQDLAMLEGTHADLKTQHEQLRTAFEADQRENAELKEKIRVLNGEVAELRPALEKLRNDARQQKGMAAINKKQLSTTEGEHEKLQSEKVDLEKTISEKAAQPAESSRETPVASIPSPAASVTSQSTNPFFRSKSPQQSVDNFMSPSHFRQDTGNAAGQSAFDSYFSSPREASSRAPPTSFGGGAVASEVAAEEPIKTPTPPPPSNAVSGFQTPPPGERNVSFETPVAAIPPPPPQSRQMTSSSLPLQSLHVPSESPTSSVKANPPASRSGFSDFAGPTATAPNEVAEEPSASNEAAASEPTVSHHIQHATIPGAFPGETEHPITTNDQFKGVESAETPRDASSSKADFDSAFASAGPSSTVATHPTHDAAPATGEFPPIQDLEQDESDSESEAGFKNNFTKPPTSEPQSSTKAANTGVSHSIEKEPMPPPLESQASPPAYESTNGKGKETSSEQFPKEYTGLLPPRQASQSSPEPPNPNNFAAAAAPDSSTHPVSAELRGPAAAKVSAAPPTDEFDSAFDDLDEAKDADEQAQEGFSFGGASRAREQDDEFNPTFDSPMPSKTNTMNDSVQHTPTTSTGRAFEQHTGSTFVSSTSPFSAAGTGQTAASTAATADSSHDWDAIFAGLDKPVAESTLNGSSSTAQEAVPSSGRLAAPGAMGSGDKGRPVGPARAVSTGAHDDPILKALTGMGYPREKALVALEKYDYNLDRAADYLTSGK